MKFIIFIIVIIFIIISSAAFLTRPPAAPGNLDSFARCLADKGLTMYGAAWCPHCQNQKKPFGSSFQFVPYVECPNVPKLCIEKGVSGYPTWIMGDTKLEGEQTLSKLSEISTCALP